MNNLHVERFIVFVGQKYRRVNPLSLRFSLTFVNETDDRNFGLNIKNNTDSPQLLFVLGLYVGGVYRPE